MLSIIIPCFNERASILRYEAVLAPELKALNSPYEVLAVDDGSSDGTAQALRDLAGRLPLKVLTHESNCGLGAALRTGFAAAQGDWIATMDADLTFHPRQIALLLKRQEETGADLVAGSPFLQSAGAEQVPWRRRLPSVMINAFYRGLFSQQLTAYTPVFRLYRASILKPMQLVSEGFEINAEIAARFVLARRPVAEAPVVLSTRTEGYSKLNRLRELTRHFHLILRLMTEPRAAVTSTPRA